MEKESRRPTYDDEIDLGELLHRLWGARRTIGIITIVVTVLASVYAYVIAPVIYESQVMLLPPRAADMEDYNLVHQLSRVVYTVPEHDERRTDARPIDNSITEATPEQAYRIFQRHLTSESLRTEFLNRIQTESSHYFPPDAMKAREALQKALVIELPTSGNEQTVLTWQGEDNEQIAQWTNDYVDRAMQLARDELLETLSSEVALRQHSTQMQSDAVRKIGRVEREHQKERLRDALQIARSIGLEDMADGPRLIAPYSDDVMYLQGSRALEAQLQILEKREIDDPFLPQLVPLRQAQLLLDRMTRVPASLSVATIDDPARVAPIPIQPNRGLIISLGAILGLMLGVFVVLIQGACRRHGTTRG